MNLRNSCRTGRWRVEGRTALRLSVLVAVVLICNIEAPVRGQGPGVDRRTAAHLLEQSTFGPTEADVDLVMSQGYEQWLNAQFAMPESPIVVPDTNDYGVSDVRNAVLRNMANGEDQLRQRMVFALSQIIVVSANKNDRGPEMTPWMRLLSRNAFLSYRSLLRDVIYSAPMGKYLDNWLNRCTRDRNRPGENGTCPNGAANSTPNENFARELLQLFSLGLWELHPNGTVKLDATGQPTPTYTQQTLVEYARALTGWTYARTNNANDFSLEMVPAMTTVQGVQQPRYHDLGQKVLLSGVVAPASANTTAALDADVEAVVESIMRHPNLAPFISSRLIRLLVTSNPSPGYIQRVATVFAGSDGNLPATLRAILLDPEARSFTSTDGRLKDPMLNILGLTRALGAPLGNAGNVQNTFSSLQQHLLTPSTVFSFYNLLTPLPGNLALLGPEFGIYPPALAVQRANFVYRILDGQVSSSFPVSLDPFIAVAGDEATLVELVNQRLMFGRMSSELRELIVAATAAIAGTSGSDMRQRALGALYLAAISSEYSVYSDTSVTGAATVQPPTGLAVASLAGSRVEITWRAPLIGPAPTGYVLEGGVRPGEVIATIPINSTSPSFTFQAPVGAFYVRLRTVAGGAVSRPSSEIRLYVGGTSGPTAPRSLTAYGRGSAVVLQWRNTFGGGEPTGVAVDVAQNGARVTSIPMPVSDRWSFGAVPNGTFEFTVRATNSSGTSGSSNRVTLTFPLSGCSNPGSPQAFSVVTNGRHISAHWLAPPSGTTPTHYSVHAEMRVRRNNRNEWASVGTFPVTGTFIASPVGPGRYRIRVRSENICNPGNTASFTGWQEVQID